jgi:predicted nucleotidyltransferase
MSLLDQVHEQLNPKIWSSDGSKLLPEVHAEILQKLFALADKDVLRQVWFIGGSASLQYNNFSDIDISVVSVYEDRSPEIIELHHKFKAHNNSMDYLTGTKHPINFFIMPNTDINWGEETTSIYLVKDLETGEQDKWYRLPKSKDELRNPKDEYPTEMIFGKMLSNIAFRRLKSLVKELKILKSGSVSGKEFHRRLRTVEKDIDSLIKMHDRLDKNRKFAYNFGWGVPKFGLNNLSYKIMDREGLLKVMEHLEE